MPLASEVIDAAIRDFRKTYEKPKPRLLDYRPARWNQKRQKSFEEALRKLTEQSRLASRATQDMGASIGEAARVMRQQWETQMTPSRFYVDSNYLGVARGARIPVRALSGLLSGAGGVTEYGATVTDSAASWYATEWYSAAVGRQDPYSLDNIYTASYTFSTPEVRFGPPATEEQRRHYRRQAQLDDKAAARAKALLLEHLDATQRKQYEESNYFHVISQGGRVYRIRRGAMGNVYRIGKDGNQEAKFCIHARDSLPVEDHMLLQMLLLRYDEEQFLQTANVHWGTRYESDSGGSGPGLAYLGGAPAASLAAVAA